MRLISALLLALAADAVAASNAFPITDFGARSDDSGELYVRGGTKVGRVPLGK